MCVPGGCPFSLLPSLLAPVLGPHPSLPCPALPPHATQFKLNAKKMEQEANKCAALRKKFEAEALVCVKKNEMVRARHLCARCPCPTACPTALTCLPTAAPLHPGLPPLPTAAAPARMLPASRLGVPWPLQTPLPPGPSRHTLASTCQTSSKVVWVGSPPTKSMPAAT